MSEKVTEHIYQCSVLHGIARVLLSRQFVPTDQTTDPLEFPATFKDCRNKDDCGIARQVGSSIEYDWDSCPASLSMKRNGRL